MWTRMSGLLFQNRCVFCQESAPPQRDLCQYCVDDLPVSEHVCLCCALPIAKASRHPAGRLSISTLIIDSEAGAGRQCGTCLLASPPVRSTVACCHYAYPADYLVQQLKFVGQLKYARVMGKLLAESVEARGFRDVDLVLPVPLSSTRYRQRGFNQAAEIAAYAAAGLRVPVSYHALLRCGDQPPQAGLGRKLRASNIRGAFWSGHNLDGQRCALVDDVMTTGATVYEAAHALLHAGAASVDVWVFARTVQPGQG